MPKRYRARKSRRTIKTSLNNAIVIAAAAVALAASSVYGQAANVYLTSATMILIGVGIILAIVLG